MIFLWQFCDLALCDYCCVIGPKTHEDDEVAKYGVQVWATVCEVGVENLSLEVEATQASEHAVDYNEVVLLWFALFATMSPMPMFATWTMLMRSLLLGLNMQYFLCWQSLGLAYNGFCIVLVFDLYELVLIDFSESV